jgi:predicted peroxiredoxin
METHDKQGRDLVVVVTHGIDHELSSVAFTIACGGITAGLRVSIFLTSGGVDLVRKRGADLTRVDPLDPLATLIRDFVERGGKIWACTPCVKSRGYTAQDLLAGVEIAGSSAMHALILQGAATLSF